MATISELQSRVTTLKAAYDAAAQDLAKAQAEYDALVAAAKSTNFKLPEQEAEFIAARERARSYRDGPLAAATTAENKAAGALYQAEQDLKDAQAAPSPAPATTPTESSGQTTTEAQTANAQSANTQRPEPAPQVASDDGTVSPSSSNATPTTAESANAGGITTGTDGRVRPASETQGLGQTNGTTDNSYQELEKRRAERALPPKDVGAAAPGDDAGGLNKVAGGITKIFGPALNVVPKDNPLDLFPSYTYNLSMYLMTPQQYNAMLSAQHPNVAGLLLLMSSGGIPIKQRNDYFPLDYYMDSLQIKTYVSGKGTMGAHTATELSFRVTEPNGLTFIHNLVKATAETVKSYGIENAFLNQLYLMVIRFQALDANGALINAPSLGGGSSDSTIIEKFIPFRITNIRTKVANRLAEYEVSAICPQNHVATGQQRGTIPYNIGLQSTTLKEIFAEFCTALNEFQVDLTKPNPEQNRTEGVFEYPDIYEIKLLPPLDDKSVTIIPPGQVSKPETGMGPNPKTAPPNQTMNPNALSTKTTVKPAAAIAGQSIVQFIDQTVRTSGYIYQQQLKYYDPKTEKLVEQSGTGQYLAWFRITTKAEPTDKWDRKRRDYSYKITYQVAPYLVTDSLSEYFPRSPRWPAPKVYYHWFTGRNTQVLDYQQDFNNLYYMVVSSGQRPFHPQSPLIDETNRGYQPTSGQTAQGSAGKVNEPSANATDRFYSPGDLAKIKMTIVGDPDWIAQGDVWKGITPTDPNATLPDGTINFASREPLFEVIYNIPADYDMNQGIVKSPEPGATADSPLPQRQTISNRYLAYWITNHFDRGKFTQELTGTIILPHSSKSNQESANAPEDNSYAELEKRRAERANPPTTTGTASTTPNTREPTTGRYGPNISTSGTLANPSTPEEISVADDSATGTEFLSPAPSGSGTVSNEPPPTVGPQPAAEPPTSNGQDVSVPQTTPQPSPSTGYVTSIPDGVTKGTTSGTYQFEGQTIVANTNDALSAQVTAIRTGNEVTYQDYDPNAGWVTKTYDPQTKTYKVIGDAPNPYANTSTNAPSQNMAQEY